MEVIRKIKKEVKKIQPGDQIRLGRYTATCMTVDSTGATFCFDQVYGESSTKSPWDEKRANILYKSKAMDSVRDLLVPFDQDNIPVLPIFRSPTAEEVFAKQHLRAVESTSVRDADKRWEAMKTPYCVAFDINGTPRPYWTESRVKETSPIYASAGTNVNVLHNGHICYSDTGKTESYIYWRPVFKLKV